MEFIVRHPALAALFLLAITSVAIILFDFKRNGMTLPRLWETLRRDRLSSAIMFLVGYAICFLCVSAGITATNFVQALLART